MPQRKLFRGRVARAGSAAAGGVSDLIGNYMKMQLQEQLSNREALRNNQLERERTADTLIANGKLSLKDRSAFVSGTYSGPSVQDRLANIIGDVTKAPTLQTTPSRVALASSFGANDIPTVDFGPATPQNLPGVPQPQQAGYTGGSLPSTPYGPISSAPFQQALQARSDKTFPLEKIGEDMGPGLQPQNIYGRTNIDTGQMDTVSKVAAGPTAQQKGTAEGTAAATSEDLTRAGKIQTATEQQAALMPGAIQQAGGEAAARAHADTQEAINRARMSGGLLPEQAQFAEQQSQQFQQASGTFWVQQEAFRRMAGMAANPSAAGDLGIISGYMKMIDPGSSVMGGETANAQNAAGVPDWIRNIYNRMLTGEKLAPNQRNDFLTQARGIYSGAVQEHNQRVQDFSARAHIRGVDPSLIVRDPAMGLDRIGTTKVVNGRILKATAVDADGNVTSTEDVGPAETVGGGGTGAAATAPPTSLTNTATTTGQSRLGTTKVVNGRVLRATAVDAQGNVTATEDIGPAPAGRRY